jgi:hypothetical protein
MGKHRALAAIVGTGLDISEIVMTATELQHELDAAIQDGRKQERERIVRSLLAQGFLKHDDLDGSLWARDINGAPLHVRGL